MDDAQNILLPKRQANKEKNRESILNAAKLVFAENGYEATNIRDIIRRTNLAAGTFYNYFKTKDEVFFALHERALAQFKPYIKSAHDEANGDFCKFIELAFLNYFRFKKANAISAKQKDSVLLGAFHHHTPEAIAIFDEIKTYIKAFCETHEGCNLNADLFTASAIGVAQELGLRIIADDNISPEFGADFAAKFVWNALKA